MENKPNNLIITCGTSQAEKYALINGPLGRDKKLKPTDLDLGDEDPPTSSYYQRRKGEEPVQTLAHALSKKWVERTRFIGRKENPFGAELSTLILMEKDGDWHPGQDHIHLLASDTRPGVTSAAIIELVLTQAAGVPPEHIHFQQVAEVREHTQSPMDAQCNLARCAVRSLQEGYHNLLVITGGFKSMIPAMTLTAFIFGLRMYYLYEDDKSLQRLDLVYNLGDPKVRGFWKKTWEQMQKKGFASDAPCLRELLQERLRNPDVYYG